MIKKLFYIFLGIAILAGCDKNSTGPEFQKEVNLFGFLHGGEYLSEENAIMINYTRPVDESYSLDAAAIENAIVKIRDHSNNTIIPLIESSSKRGFYYNDTLKIKFGVTYTLEVVADEKTVSATTTVPMKITLESDLASGSVNQVYQDDLGFEKPIKVISENPDQIIFVEMFCNEEWQNAEFIESFGDRDSPDSQENYDGGVNGPPRHIFNFMRVKDLKTDIYPGEYVIFWYHAMIVFYGSNTLQVLAIDDNYHNYLYSEHPELSGGVVGGIGVFGAVNGEKYDLFVLKK